jgi:hypothetical protein
LFAKVGEVTISDSINAINHFITLIPSADVFLTLLSHTLINR